MMERILVLPLWALPIKRTFFLAMIDDCLSCEKDNVTWEDGKFSIYSGIQYPLAEILETITWVCLGSSNNNSEMSMYGLLKPFNILAGITFGYCGISCRKARAYFPQSCQPSAKSRSLFRVLRCCCLDFRCFVVALKWNPESFIFEKYVRFYSTRVHKTTRQNYFKSMFGRKSLNWT